MGDNPLHESHPRCRAGTGGVSYMVTSSSSPVSPPLPPSLPLSFPSVIPLLSLHSCHFSPIFLAAFSPPPSSNHPLFCPLYYIRHMDQCTDMSLQICFCLLILHLLSPPLLDYSLIHLTNQTIKPRSTANRGNDMTLLERTCALCCCCLERNYNLISCLSQGKGFKLFLE